MPRNRFSLALLLYMYENLLYERHDVRSMGKRWPFKKMVPEQVESHLENDKTAFIPHTIIKNKVQMYQWFKCNETISDQ